MCDHSRGWPFRWFAVLSIGALATIASHAHEPAGPTAKHAFTFRNTSESAGLIPAISGIRGHGAAWGDIDGDGYPDLFVATFHNGGSRPSLLLRNQRGHLALDPQEQVRTSGMGSGALFVDLNNSGRLDLYVSNCTHGRVADELANPNSLFRNDGDGRFTDVSKASGACLPRYAGRGVAAADFDGDGLLDLLTCERYYGDVDRGPCLFRNLGNYRFEDIAAKAGLPARLGGLAAVAADLNQDGWPDVLLTSGNGDHRLYVNNRDATFREVPGSRDTFRWELARDDDTPAGASIADVNRDGLPDIVIGHHFKHPWHVPAPIRLYLHQGIKQGNPSFKEVTAAAGLTPLAFKGPHVEFQDFDNDGWPDLYVSIVKFDGSRPHPLIYKNLGSAGGHVRFREDIWSVNDFPNDSDLRTRGGSRGFFEKVLGEGKITYSAAAPSGDYDRDGRLDVMLTSWWIDQPSLLLHNETTGGNWLDVQLEGSGGINRLGLGAKIRVFPAGKSAPQDLLCEREMAIGYGYCSGQEAIAHFGLGDVKTVDLEIILPHGKGKVVKSGVDANQRTKIEIKPSQEGTKKG